MNLLSPVCPVCGEKTMLCEPNHISIKSRYGVNHQGIPYFSSSELKFFPYTVFPKSSYKNTNPPPYKADLTHYYSYIKRYSIVVISDMVKDIKKGKAFRYFNPDYSFRCSECNSKLSFNYNPFCLCYFRIMQIIVMCVSVSVIFGLYNSFILLSRSSAVAENNANQHLIYCSVMLTALVSVIAVFTVTGYFITKKYFSNIIHTTVEDEVIVPDTHIKMLYHTFRKAYLHTGNVFCTDIDGYKFHVYLANKDGVRLEFSICAPEEERSHILQLLNNSKQNSLSLEFEGKPVGEAQIIELTTLNPQKGIS